MVESKPVKQEVNCTVIRSEFSELTVQHPLEALLRLDRPLAVPDLGRRGDLEDSHQHEQDVRHLVHLKLEDLLQHFAVAVG